MALDGLPSLAHARYVLQRLNAESDRPARRARRPPADSTRPSGQRCSRASVGGGRLGDARRLPCARPPGHGPAGPEEPRARRRGPSFPAAEDRFAGGRRACKPAQRPFDSLPRRISARPAARPVWDCQRSHPCARNPCPFQRRSHVARALVGVEQRGSAARLGEDPRAGRSSTNMTRPRRRLSDRGRRALTKPVVAGDGHVEATTVCFLPSSLPT